MSLDRNPPNSRAQARILIVGLVAMGVFGAALFGGVVPGLTPNYAAPSTIPLDGEPYYYTSVTLNVPALLKNSTGPQPFAFHNVSFYLWVTNWEPLSWGLVRGNGTEANGTVFPFVLGNSAALGVNLTLYVSPDRVFAVYWPGGFLAGPSVRLMVRA